MRVETGTQGGDVQTQQAVTAAGPRWTEGAKSDRFCVC